MSVAEDVLHLVPSVSMWFDPHLYMRKALDGSKEPITTARFVSLVSATGNDFQTEWMDQDGLDWSYWKKSGFFNWEHQPGAENLLGYPDNSVECVTRCKDAEGNPATRVVGCLLLGTDEKPHVKGRGIYQTAMALQASGSGRQIGCSVEGPVIERDPRNARRILKAQVRAIAITTNPVRDTCRFEIVKSLTALQNRYADMYKSDGIGAVGYQGAPEMSGEDLSPLLIQSIDSRLAHAAGYAGVRGALSKRFPELRGDAMEKACTNLLKYIELTEKHSLH